MTEIFFISLAPATAREVAALIARKADEAEKSQEGSEVYVGLAKDSARGRFSANAAVLAPGVRLVIERTEGL